MSGIITVGLDLAKNVFQVLVAYGAGRAVLHKKLRRAQVLGFFSERSPFVNFRLTVNYFVSPKRRFSLYLLTIPVSPAQHHTIDS